MALNNNTNENTNHEKTKSNDNIFIQIFDNQDIPLLLVENEKFLEEAIIIEEITVEESVIPVTDFEQNNTDSSTSFLNPKETAIKNNCMSGTENIEYQSQTMEEETSSRKKKYRVTREQRYENKELRMRGKPYKGLIKDKRGKYQLNNEIGPRILGPTCTTESCKNSKVFFCSTFTITERRILFEEFWNTLTWDMKRTYISSLVDYIPSKRKKEGSRRNGTLVYYLKKDTTKLRVCKKMFLSTLGVGEWMVHEYSKKSYGIHKSEKDVSMKQRNRQQKDNRRLTLKSFLEELPKLPSHYCRASTSKVYLEPTFQSNNDLYREYQKYCSERGVNSLSLQVVKEEIRKMNIGIYKPRKDQCDLCLSYKLGYINDLVYQKHQANKIQSRMSKDEDKELCTKNAKEIAVFTVDLQAVKMAPMLKASAIYYKTKLCVHNYTVYNLCNGEVTCFLWDESQGGLEANIFASLLVNFIEDYLSKELNTRKIIIYSDGCGYQNKNVIVSNALLKLAVDKQITIIQKYFEKGHSQMEVDSVHSAIETRLKNRDIYLPTDYIAACREARSKNPYLVKYMNYTNFQDYSKVRFYGSIRPGTKIGDPQVNEVRSFAYLPEGHIQYKLSYTDEWKNLPKRVNNGEFPVLQLYKFPPKIKQEKYNHLQQLKKVLHEQFWPFYDDLPH